MATRIHIIDHDSGWLAVEKPWGMSIHNDPGADLISLVSAQVAGTPMEESLIPDTGFGFHSVHRIDRDTSGIVLMACRQDSFRFFSHAFETRKVVKEYRAILHGNLLKDLRSNSKNTQGQPVRTGKWTRPLTKRPGGRSRPEGKGKKVPCETQFEVLKTSPHYSFVSFFLVTGRKHQIRRHAALAGHPVAGDKRYAPARAIKFLQSRMKFMRMALHAYSLTIPVPDGELKTLSTGGIPEEMTALFKQDRIADIAG